MATRASRSGSSWKRSQQSRVDCPRDKGRRWQEPSANGWRPEAEGTSILPASTTVGACAAIGLSPA
eukprot:6232485-Heterocapsa_arctica.AAC.1